MGWLVGCAYSQGLSTPSPFPGSLVHEGSPNGEQFLCVGGAEGEEQSIPEVTVKRCFQTTGDLDTPTPSGNKTVLRSLGDSILEGMEVGTTPVGSTPFSTQRTTHIPGEVGVLMVKLLH